MNKLFVIVTILVACVVIVLPITKNIKETHNDKMIKVTENKIKEAAKKCYLDNVCNNETTLGTLYQKKYIEKQSNPVTKKYYDESSVIKLEDKKVVLYLR